MIIDNVDTESATTNEGTENVLDEVAEAVFQGGLVGEDRAAKLIYLALTTRLLSKPVSVKVTGPSSAGKSYVTSKVLQLFPEDAYYELSSMSEKALVYSEEPLQHRFLRKRGAGLEGRHLSHLPGPEWAPGRAGCHLGDVVPAEKVRANGAIHPS